MAVRRPLVIVGSNVEELPLGDTLPGVGGGMTVKQQVFTSSGTFTPSTALLDAGGMVEVLLVGGGGGGSNAVDAFSRTGGSGGEVKRRIVQVESAVTVTIGAGGSSVAANVVGNGGAGGTSSFGALVTALGGDGGKSATAMPGRSVGEGSGAGAWVSFGTMRGGVGAYGFSYGGPGNSGAAYANSAPGSGGPGSDAANAASGAGVAGICIVTWWE